MFVVKTNTLCSVSSLLLAWIRYIEDSGKSITLDSYYMICLCPFPTCQAELNFHLCVYFPVSVSLSGYLS